jgi:hypothetical protein
MQCCRSAAAQCWQTTPHHRRAVPHPHWPVCRVAQELAKSCAIMASQMRCRHSLHACRLDGVVVVTLLLETVEDFRVNVTPGRCTKAPPPPKSVAVLFCNTSHPHQPWCISA